MSTTSATDQHEPPGRHHMSSTNRRRILDRDYDALADEAERGLSGGRRVGRPSLSSSGAPSVTVRVRMAPGMAEALEKVASERGTTKSDVMRDAFGLLLLDRQRKLDA